MVIVLKLVYLIIMKQTGIPRKDSAISPNKVNIRVPVLSINAIVFVNLSLENTHQIKQANLDYITRLEDEIFSIEKEINRLNSNKEKTINDAMENNSKELVIQNNNKKLFSKIKLFFRSKINPNKVIFENVINPMKQYIKDYNDNVLENIKG